MQPSGCMQAPSGVHGVNDDAVIIMSTYHVLNSVLSNLHARQVEGLIIALELCEILRQRCETGAQGPLPPPGQGWCRSGSPDVGGVLRDHVVSFLIEQMRPTRTRKRKSFA